VLQRSLLYYCRVKDAVVVLRNISEIQQNRSSMPTFTMYSDVRSIDKIDEVLVPGSTIQNDSITATLRIRM
jgi:hypothetical protein